MLQHIFIFWYTYSFFLIHEFIWDLKWAQFIIL